MLFDEPTSALDPQSVSSVLCIMEDLAAAGLNGVCITHEMGFARRVADRCAFMEKGVVVEQASASQFFKNSTRLASFLKQVL